MAAKLGSPLAHCKHTPPHARALPRLPTQPIAPVPPARPAGVKQWVLPSSFVDLVNWVNQKSTPPVYNFIQARPCLPCLMCCAALCSAVFHPGTLLPGMPAVLCCGACMPGAWQRIGHQPLPERTHSIADRGGVCALGVAGGAWAGGGAGEWGGKGGKPGGARPG
jgi:hypothetical protein